MPALGHQPTNRETIASLLLPTDDHAGGAQALSGPTKDTEDTGRSAQRPRAQESYSRLHVEQGVLESGLLKVPIGGQGVSQVALLHHHERDAVGESPFLVWS
jgi:hypothetical protein